MRNELELIATIERYLNNQLSAWEKEAFEKQLAGDRQLQEEVTLQRELMQGLERVIYKQQIQRARKKFFRARTVTRWGLTGLTIIVVTVAIIYFARQVSHHKNSSENTSLPEYNELHEKGWADADKSITPQVFLLDALRDTVIETKGGMVLMVPANGFLNEAGKPVTGKIELSVKEALDPASIIRAGLSSTSGDQLLESAGMFYVDARQSGNILTINPNAGLHVEIPTDTIQPGMQLYKGKRLANGTIDWIAPQPLDHNLTPVDINGLNFYPPHYLDSLASWGYDILNKKFTDSLYYSFADCFHPDHIAYEESTDSAPKRPRFNCDGCAINPAKIKAIWNEKFQNTILATREFEERLYWIHRIADKEVLDLYAGNLDKKLYEIDSILAQKLPDAFKKEFVAFAARREGTVPINSVQAQKLRRFYESKTRAFMNAVAKTNNAFWEKQAQLDEVANKKQWQHNNDSLNRIKQLFTEEFTMNLKNAYQQLGYDTSIKLRRPNAPVYKANIIATGWYNIDRAVYESTANRTTVMVIDTITGKTATIKYQPVSFQINKQEQYDRLYVYLLPDKLNSFMRLTGNKGKYTEQLNELVHYKMVCIAYKGEQAFFYEQAAVEPKTYTGIELSPVDQHALQQQLNRTGKGRQGTGLIKDLEFYQFMHKDGKRQQHNQDLWELRMKTGEVLFDNCEGGASCCYFIKSA